MKRAKPRYKPRCLGRRNGEVGMLLRGVEYWYKPELEALDVGEWERRFDKIYAISAWKGLRYLLKRGRLVRRVSVKRISLLDS